VDKDFQITIPESMRGKAGFEIGDALFVYFQDGKLIFEKKSGDIKSVRIKLHKKIDSHDVENTVREAGESIAEDKTP
jgi:antitoxin PrlF